MLQAAGSYQLDPMVGLRDERFGALAYHYGNRRLTFLNDRRLVDVVRQLETAPDVAAALAIAQIPADQTGGFLVALERLADAGVIVERNS